MAICHADEPGSGAFCVVGPQPFQGEWIVDVERVGYGVGAFIFDLLGYSQSDDHVLPLGGAR